ncbi:hypothetical protein [Massilia sp. DWR3-1-1]|uniref:hypothetical protein n=1 Tax=Massilia sp. DWR3-1-1 TaxID=2804559 RepID=UPI003CF5DF61
MDQQKLRTLVFEKTGVKIDLDDPVFALVALNEAVLAEAVERHVALIEQASDAMAARLAGPLAGAPAPVRAAAPVAPAAHVAVAATGPALLAGAAAVLGAVLVLLGQALWFKPVPAPAAVVQARELSADQGAALRQADKLDKIIQKLDPKTRATIRAEMQKP